MGRFTSDSGGGNFVQAPVGTHLARCIKIVDIGTQHGEYQGKPNKRNQIIVSWELPTEMDDEGRPIIASKFYTNSIKNERATFKLDLEAWRGRAFTQQEENHFDRETILGVACLLTIVSGTNDRTKVAGVSGLPKGMECPAQVNPSFSFWLEEFDQGKFNSLSEGIQNLIKKSDEYDELVNGAPEGESRESEPSGVAPF